MLNETKTAHAPLAPQRAFRQNWWTDEESQTIAQRLGGTTNVKAKELDDLLPGRTGRVVLDRWYNMKSRTRLIDGVWVFEPPSAVNWPQAPRGYTAETMRWARKAVLARDVDAICILGMTGVDMRRVFPGLKL